LGITNIKPENQSELELNQSPIVSQVEEERKNDNENKTE